MSEKKPYTTVLFDLDGTLTDPEIGITTCFQYALQHFGIEENDREKLRRVIGPPLLDSFMQYYGLSEDDAQLGIKYYRERFSDIGIFENTVYDGIPEMLNKLKEAGKKLVLATSKPHVYANRILEYFDLAKYIAFVAGSELDGTRTDKAEVIRYALEQTGTAADEAIMVGDRKHDVIGAIKNHMDVIGVLYGHGSEEELLKADTSLLAQTPADVAKLIL